MGCTIAACYAEMGHQIVGIDPSPGKVDLMNAGRSPIEEPQLAELLDKAKNAGLLSAQSTIDASLADCDAAFVCVGTPTGPDGDHDMRFIVSVTRDIAKALSTLDRPEMVIAYRSTMRPGTLRKLVQPMLTAELGEERMAGIDLVYNPEFLRESTAVKDFFAPPKIVFGSADASPNHLMDELHEGIEAARFHVRWEEAELTKFVDNSWHALKVGFANEIGRICLAQGLDPSVVHAIFKSDEKLNLSAYYTRPGGPFGGSCLPKDVKALRALSGELRAQTPIVDSLVPSNDAHKNFLSGHVLERYEAGSSILVSGVAFKAQTDDLRESPNVALVRRLLDAGYKVRIFDPAVSAEKLVGQNLGYAYSQLPQLSALLIDKAGAEAENFDLAIRTNATFSQLDLGDTPVLNFENLSGF